MKKYVVYRIECLISPRVCNTTSIYYGESSGYVCQRDREHQEMMSNDSMESPVTEHQGNLPQKYGAWDGDEKTNKKQFIDQKDNIRHNKKKRCKASEQYLFQLMLIIIVKELLVVLLLVKF